MHLMGIETRIPGRADLRALLKLLARSSTVQPLTVYTNLITGPRRAGDVDGPQQLHIVLLDNGRSRLLGGEFQDVLSCIRCGACLNACPVYRNIGGHAYASVYPGPIGSLVTPLLQGVERNADLPRASSLCGACMAACPVKIDIPHLLVKLRARSLASTPWSKRIGMRIWRWGMTSASRYEFAQWLLRRIPVKQTGDGWILRGPGPLTAWTSIRDLPPPPKRTFRQLWRDGLQND